MGVASTGVLLKWKRNGIGVVGAGRVSKANGSGKDKSMPMQICCASPNGNDGAAGTVDDPWKTLVHSIASMQPGYTLQLRGGIYPENLGGGLPSGTSWGNAINVEAYW